MWIRSLTRFLRWCSPLLFMAALLAVEPAPSVPGWRLREGGLWRHFDLATDEFQIRGDAVAAGVRRLPERGDSAAVLSEVRRSLAQGEEACLVVYERGRPRTPATRRVLTRQVIAEWPLGDLARVEALGLPDLERVEALSFAPGFYRFVSREPDGAPSLCRALARTSGIRSAEVQLARWHATAHLPNDPLFVWQWHLAATVTNSIYVWPAVDIHVTPVWDAYRGRGVTIGIVDTGVQYTHPDLLPNLDPALAWDFIGADTNANPSDYSVELHGTAVAGLAAARGDNGLGLAGVAYEAKLAPLRLVTPEGFSDEEAAAAFGHRSEAIHIKNNSWGSGYGGSDLAGVGAVVSSALAHAAETGRSGRGSLVVFSAGNEAESAGNVNYDAIANSIYVVPVAAVSPSGVAEPYSNPGAALVVAAPGGASLGRRICTTDLVGRAAGYNQDYDGTDFGNSDYTSRFAGTSASAPIVSGVIALLLEANPALGWRDVQEILLRTASRNDASSPGWAVNGGGLHFHHQYGAGLVDAAAAVALARVWTNLPPARSLVLDAGMYGAPIPNGGSPSLSVFFACTNENLRVEHVRVRVDIDHPYRGQLALALVSPSGMVSRLAESRSDTNANYENWRFTSRAHWTESSRGVWRLDIVNLGAVGTLQSARLEILGTPAGPWEVLSTAFSEHAGAANGNGQPDPGEDLELRTVLQNVTSGTLTGAVVQVVSLSSNATVLAARATVGPAGPGATATNADPVLIRVPRTLACGEPLSFQLLVTSGATLLTNYLQAPLGRAIDSPERTNVWESAEVPQGITDLGTAYSTLAVPVAATERVLALQVRVRLDHTAVGDLQVALRSPQGIEVLLADHAGGNAADFGTGACGDGSVPTTFDDAALTEVGFGSVPFAGHYRPAEPLAAFSGQPAAGTWTLRVSDQYDLDEGILLCWSLRIVSNSRTYACEPFSGDTVFGLPQYSSLTGFEAQVQGIPGAQYYLETSPDLEHWESVPLPVQVASPFRLWDPQATNLPARFYRLQR